MSRDEHWQFAIMLIILMTTTIVFGVTGFLAVAGLTFGGLLAVAHLWWYAHRSLTRQRAEWDRLLRELMDEGDR